MFTISIFSKVYKLDLVSKWCSRAHVPFIYGMLGASKVEHGTDYRPNSNDGVGIKNLTDWLETTR